MWSPPLQAGYQITQLDHPIASDGHLDFIVYNAAVHRKPYRHSVKLIQIQLEEDSGKSIHDKENHRWIAWIFFFRESFIYQACWLKKITSLFLWMWFHLEKKIESDILFIFKNWVPFIMGKGKIQHSFKRRCPSLCSTPSAWTM